MKSPYLLKVIISLNVLVTLGWFLSGNTPWFSFMLDNFLISWTGLEEGRFWTLLTSAFSHSSLFHLMINMYVLFGFGIVLHQLLGPAAFLNFYLISGISGSFMHALMSKLFIGEPGMPALGASGAIAGIVLLFSLSFPREKLLLMGLIPIRAGWAAVLIISLDLWGLIAQTKGGGLPIGHGAHLGGALMGIIWYFAIRNKKENQVKPPL
ncbi:MAG TPA: rhomboid family intramembrane serine protease [Bacteriovoracaceae bacterium]|nr:rhomboid family intramembrane serine protease [Bacteriovoracaceae bacterium]